MKYFYFFGLTPFFFFLFIGCAYNPPLEHYVLARTASQVSKNIDAVKFAPASMSRAEEEYKKAKKLFEEKKFEEAEIHFINSRIYFEKSENKSRIIKYKKGMPF